jgi:GNAT superfamily N-acetyltransferase
LAPEIRQATPADRLYIKHLQRRFNNQIGFIPTPATERELEAGNIIMGELNDSEAGFLLIRPQLSGQRSTAAILQAAVQFDAQRHQVGTALLTAVANKTIANGSTILQASCRDGLQANLFWRDMGFIEAARRPGGNTHAREIIIWRLPLVHGVNLFELPTPKIPHGPGGKFVKKATTGSPKELKLLF